MLLFSLAVPAITGFPERDIIAVRKSSVSIQCRATGYPLPDILWYKDIQDQIRPSIKYQISSFIQEQDGFGFVSSALTLRSIEAADGGSYTCKAVSGLGGYSATTDSNSIHIIIPCK